MTVTLSASTRTSDATGLTAGASYSIYHKGGVRCLAPVGADWHPIYEQLTGGAVTLHGIPGTSLRFELATGETAATIEVTELA